MNPKLQARMAHLVDSKAANQRPAYYDLIKFAIEKEAEINCDETEKIRDLTLEEGSDEGETTPLPSKESDSGKSYKATQDDATIP